MTGEEFARAFCDAAMSIVAEQRLEHPQDIAIAVLGAAETVYELVSRLPAGCWAKA